MEWLMRMKDAVDYIEDKLTDQLELDDIAKRACSSPYHFQRMFHMLTGFTVTEYIRQRRLTLAAQELAVSGGRVVDIALKYGYESPESFAKVFRKTHGITPSDARVSGVNLKAFPRISFQLSLKGDKDMDYQIVKRSAFSVTGKMIRVSLKNGENLNAIPRFWQESYQDGTVEKLRALHPNQTLLGICMDCDMKREEMNYVIATEGSYQSPDDQWVTVEIPTSTWAVFPSHGALPDAIHGVWNRIFEEWFPGTGYEHTGGPEIELLPGGDDLSPDYHAEVWVPVTKK